MPDLGNHLTSRLGSMANAAAASITAAKTAVAGNAVDAAALNTAIAEIANAGDQLAKLRTALAAFRETIAP